MNIVGKANPATGVLALDAVGKEGAGITVVYDRRVPVGEVRLYDEAGRYIKSVYVSMGEKEQKNHGRR